MSHLVQQHLNANEIHKNTLQYNRLFAQNVVVELKQPVCVRTYVLGQVA